LLGLCLAGMQLRSHAIVALNAALVDEVLRGLRVNRETTTTWVSRGITETGLSQWRPYPGVTIPRRSGNSVACRGDRLGRLQ